MCVTIEVIHREISDSTFLDCRLLEDSWVGWLEDFLAVQLQGRALTHYIIHHIHPTHHIQNHMAMDMVHGINDCRLPIYCLF